MNTKGMMRWGVVLCLLAALPVMTAVMAQGEEPAQQAPKVSGVYESPSPDCTFWETEGNDNRAQANRVSSSGAVICGTIDGGNHDRDWFRFRVPHAPTYRLFDIDALSIGSELLPVVCLANERSYIGCQYYSLGPDTGQAAYDPLLLGNVSSADEYYYVEVSNYRDLGSPGSFYKLVMSKPILLSAAAAGFAKDGDVAGIHFYSEDVLAVSSYDKPGGGGGWKWVLLFDGSDVGVKTLTNLASGTGEELLFTPGSNQSLPGIGAVSQHDIIRFYPFSWGPVTSGFFQMGLNGEEHGLTTNGEKLDAIDGLTIGVESDPLYRGCFGIPVSTVGVANVTGPFGKMKQDDEDIFCKVYNQNHGGWQHWDWFFDVDGTNDAPPSEHAPGNVPGLAGEDVVAMAYDDKLDYMLLTIQGSGNIGGVAVTQRDIFAIDLDYDYGWRGLVWHGPNFGWNYNIDAFEWNNY